MKFLHCLVLMLGGAVSFAQAPLDDICKRKVLAERKPLAYAPIQERDILWEKRVWRIIDLKQKMNQYFAAPKANFCSILIDGIKAGEITAFSPEDEKFSFPMPFEEMLNTVQKTDTVEVINPDTGVSSFEVVTESLNPEDIKKIRIKEVWYFDTQHSALKVRILGIAPVIDMKDNFDNVIGERPLFWVHYPSIRTFLSKEPVILAGNDNHAISWEDQLERRFFASRIYKVSNVHDTRISDSYAGLDALQQAAKLEQEIFNFEHDLWSY